MNLDVTKVLSGLQNHFDFENHIKLLQTSLDEINAVFASEFSVCGSVSKSGQKLILKMAYQGEITFPCDRCLEDVKLDFEHTVTRELTLEPLDDECVLIIGNTVSIDPILEEDVMLNLPLHIRCREDCLGLCPQCGINLNNGKCKCEDEKIDPRLEALKNFIT